MLEFYTNEELIKELANRKTFLGIIVSSDEFKDKVWKGQKLNFRIRSKNVSRLQSLSVLHAAAKTIYSKPCK